MRNQQTWKGGRGDEAVPSMDKEFWWWCVNHDRLDDSGKMQENDLGKMGTLAPLCLYQFGDDCYNIQEGEWRLRFPRGEVLIFAGIF